MKDTFVLTHRYAPHQQTSHDTIALEVIAEESSNDETAMSPYSFSPAIGWIAALSQLRMPRWFFS
jgi:hypothetical protein